MSILNYLALFLVCFNCVNSFKQDPLQNFELFKYDAFFQKIKDLMFYPQMLKVTDAYAEYPDIKLDQCGEERCVFPVIEMTNFENGSDYIDKLPTILVLGGARGHELVGINSIYQYANLFVKYARYQEAIFGNLNNVRMIMLPVVNPRGFYEFSHRLKQPKELSDALKGFNWQGVSTCFDTSASELLNHLFRDNLIIGAMVFGDGRDTVKHPWMTLENDSFLKENPDQDGYRRFVHTISEITQLTFDQKNTVYELSSQISNNHNMAEFHSDFVKWAYMGSEVRESLGSTCLPKDSNYNEDFLRVDAESNRAFVIEINFNETVAQESGKLGNEMSILNKMHPNSLNGYISRNLWSVFQLVEVIRPTVFISSLRLLEPFFGKKSHQLEFYLDIRGCFNVESVRVVSDEEVGQSLELEKPNFSYKTMVVNATFLVDIDPDDEKWKNGGDLQIQVECDNRLKNSPEHSFKSFSHFMRSKNDEEYTAKKGRFEYLGSSLQLLSIRNIQPRNLFSSFVFHEIYNEIEYIYEDTLAIMVKGEFPLILTHEKKNKKIQISLNEGQVQNSSLKRGPVYDKIKSHADDLRVTFFEGFVRDPAAKDLTGVRQPKLFKGNQLLNISTTHLNRFRLDYNIRMGQNKQLLDSWFFDLVGKQVFIDLGNNEGFTGMALLSSQLSRDQSFKQQTSLYTQKDQSKLGRGMLMPETGLYCDSSFNSLDSANSRTTPGFKMEIKYKPLDLEHIQISLELEGSHADESLVFWNHFFKVELVKTGEKAVSDKTYTEFNGFTSRLNYKILGLAVAVYKTSGELIFDCVPEKSEVIIDEDTRKDIVKSLIFKNQIEEAYFEDQNLDQNSELYKPRGFTVVFLLVLIYGGLAGIGWFIWSLFERSKNKIDPGDETDMEAPLENENEVNV